MAKPKSDLPTIILHWAILITLVVSLITGLRIAADMPDATWAQNISALLLQGNVIFWHLVSALFFIGLIAAYTMFLWRAGALGRVALNRRWYTMLTTVRIGFRLKNEYFI